MNRILVILSALVAGALLIPDVAEAQRGGRGGGGFGGGGARMGGGGFGGGGAFRGGGGFRGGSVGAGPRMYIPGGGSGFRGGAIAARPGMPGRVAGISPGTGSFRQAAIANPGRRFDNRVGNRGDYFRNRNDWRYGVRPPGTWGGRYPNYGGRYPYYGRYYGRYPYYGGWGLATGALIGAAATYPYYDYPYYNYPYATYQTPVASADGGYCVTAVRTCALTNSAPIGTGCSCRVQGGRARGTVQ
ncbi:MAG: hypothetical protein K0R61_932 [Microvirga sp.]|nr:hypothetical protein [Microvirga sp.]